MRQNYYDDAGSETRFLNDYESYWKKMKWYEKLLCWFWEGWDSTNRETGETKRVYWLLVAYIVAAVACVACGYFVSWLFYILAVVLVAVLVFLRKKYNEIDRHISALVAEVLDVLKKAKLLGYEDDVSWWSIREKNHSEGQYLFNIECRKPGVNIAAKMKDIELSAKQTYMNGCQVYDVYFKPLGGVRYELVFDTRNPFEETSEMFDFLRQGNGLPVWDMPLNEEGNPKGVIALGAVDKGVAFGSVNTGLLWQHHFGISGISGYGKSNAVHFLLYQISQFPNVQIVYIDPNETDGALWNERAIVVGRAGAGAALDKILAEMERRAQFMKKQGWAKWKAMPQLPQLVVVIDEIKFLVSSDKEAKKKIENVLAIGRKYGISCILGTQYPKKEYVGGAWENLHYKLSSKLNNETECGVVFGAKAVEAPCDKIETKGTFYAMDDKGKIERVHVPYVPESVVLDMAAYTSGLKSQQYSSIFGNIDAVQKSKSKAKKYGF